MSITPRLRTAVILLAVILVVSITLALGLRKLTLSIDGQSQTVTTYAFTVGNLFHALDIPLSPVDELSPSIDAWLKNGDQIILIRAIPVQILAGEQIRSLYSADRTPSSLFAEAGVYVRPGDQVLSNGRVIEPSQPFPANIKSISLQLLPLRNYSLTVDETTTDLTSTAPTLGSALG
jgi:hypothetical protein